MTVLAIAALIVSSSVLAKDDVDLVNCRWRTGLPLTPGACEGFRRLAAQEAEKKAKEQREQQESREREAAFQARRAAEAEEWQRKIQQARDEELRKQAEGEKLQAQRDEEYERAERTLKAECGADYRKPRIGMTLNRARRCVADFDLVSEINRKDGIVSTYRADGVQIHVMNGKIGAWQRY